MRSRIAVAMLVLLAGAGAAAARAQDDRPPGPDSYRTVDVLPEAIHKVPARCPAPATEAGAGGTVIVQVLVGRDGLVKDGRVVRSVPLLDGAALEAARGWVFKPAESDGRPVAVWVAIPFTIHCGTGGGNGAPEPGPAGEDPREAFVQEIIALQAAGVRVPSAADSVRRLDIIRDARALETEPNLPAEARIHFDRGRHAQDACACRDSSLRAVAEFTRALDEAPWWGQPHRRLAEALLLLDRREEAVVCLALYLAAEPDAPDREKVERRIAGLGKVPHRQH